MAHILDDKDLEEILEEVGTPLYFFQKEKAKERAEFMNMYEDDGSVIVTFTSSIAKIEPNDEDLAGKIWVPRLKDKEGNPIMDRQGRTRQPWDKFEAKCRIKNKEIVYGLGGKNGVLFRGLISEMKKNKLSNKQIPGSKWKIKCIDMSQYKWDIEYLGEGEIKPDKDIQEELGPSKDESLHDKVIDAVEQMKKNSRTIIMKGLEKGEFIETVAFLGHVEEKEVEKLLSELEKESVIKIVDEKIFIQ